MSRFKNSARNIAFTLGSNVLESILGIISRTVFIATLGAEYLGLAGLLQNILGFLSITELGIATAIGFSLYKPLAAKDYKIISSLMSLYRKAYMIVASIVFIGGIGFYFLLDFFIAPQEQPPETQFAYFVFLLNTILGYLLSYKSTLLNSDNKTYRLSGISIVLIILQFVVQVTCLFATESYAVYLVVILVFSAVRMLVSNRLITKWYPDVDFRTYEELPTAVKRQLKRNVSGLIIAKIGDYLVNSTDNLIITKLVSLTATGIYSNYLLIRNIVNGYISTIFSGITASMGNVVAVENDEKKLEIFETTLFCAYFVYSFEAVCFMCLFNPFIGEIWIGKKYLFDTFTVAIIVINNFLTGMRVPLITMKSAAGKYMEDAWIPFAFAGINLIASIVLAKYMGVAGVFLGTIIGSLLTADWYRPVVIYKNVFHTSVCKYFKKYIRYVIFGIMNVAIAYYICSFLHIPNVLLNFIIKASVAVAWPILFNIIIFSRSKEFNIILKMGKSLLSMLRFSKG